MTRLALITDTHYGCRKNSKPFHDYFGKFYEKVFFPYLEENNISEVIHLGDVFDNRRSIDYQALSWSKENVFDKLKGKRVHVLVGNHDAYFKNTNDLNSVELLLDSYDNISVYKNTSDAIIDGTKITFVPWLNSENRQDFEDHIKNTDSRILMGHLELNGFQSIPGHIFTGGMDPNILSKFTTVFSGHFHHRSKIGNIEYLGNPYQMFWNDYRCERGFHIFDTDTGSLKFIHNPYEIFKKIHYTDAPESPIDFRTMNLDPFKDCFIKVIVDKKRFQNRFENFISRLYAVGVHDIKVIEDSSFVQHKEATISESEDTLSVLMKYVDSVQLPVDSDALKSDIQKIYVESCRVE